jgi:plasmid rolling circle replication initiator protein Rep
MCNIVHQSHHFNHNNNALLNISHSICTFKHLDPCVYWWPSCMHTIFFNNDSGSYQQHWHILLSRH